MYDPFKRSRTNARKRMQRATKTAFGKLLTGTLPATAPAKRKAAKTTTPLAKMVAPKGKTRTAASARPKPAPKPPSTARARTTRPRGASFRSGLHRCEFGERAFKLYIPAVAKQSEGALPLVVMLHGCSQSPDDFARGTGMNVLAEEFGFLVLYPAQERKTQMFRCWSWYKRSDQTRGAGEPALLASLVRDVIARQGADLSRVYVAASRPGRPPH